jgi:CheY-like chemotaxis protein
MSIDVFKDYLSFAEPGPENGTVVEALEELEKLLASSEHSRARLGFLETLRSRAVSASDDPEKNAVRVFPNPLTPPEMRNVVEKGIVEAYREGLVKADKLFRLAHSPDGIKEFTIALAGSPAGSTASCWEGALTVPFPVPGPISLPRPGANVDSALPIEVVVEKPRVTYIIYIDDVEDEARAVTDVFRSRFEGKYRVRGFTSPSHALAFIKAKEDAGHLVAAVVTDMYMPQEFHGDEFARKLHLVDPAIPVLGYSGHNRFQDPEEAKRAGLIDLLPKQSTETTILLDTVASIVSRRIA